MISAARKGALSRALVLTHPQIHLPCLCPSPPRPLTTTTTSRPTPSTPFTSILIANRGEIALRVSRTAKDQGIRCTTIFTDPDAQSQHAFSSPYAVNLGPANAYLDGERIIAIAKAQGCQALHPGYGFLSENPAFARRCEEEGVLFIGPPWRAIEDMGDKSRSKEIMIRAGVPCIPGYHGSNQEPGFLLEEARKIGFPVMVKAVKGGGGKGMRVVLTEEEFLGKLESAKSEGRNAFGDDIMLVEKYISKPRHIEVQVFADRYGNAVALGERDCSLQRRHQKILEEAPAPNLEEPVRLDLWEKARAAALAVGYEGAGTVEFIFDNDTKAFFFMEMNTRLQVEHPVTEMITGEDLVSWQLKIAAGEALPLDQVAIAKKIAERGWGIEARIYAENPDQNFMPDSGKLVHLRTPKVSDSVRIDAGFVEGDTVSSAYDGMIAKLIVSGPTREITIRKLYTALEEYEVVGLSTNLEFLKRICISPDFVNGDVETGYIQKHHHELFTPKIIEPETYAQAALALFAKEIASNGMRKPHGEALGFAPSSQRSFSFLPATTTATAAVTVTLNQLSPNTFEASISEPSNASPSSEPKTTTYESLTLQISPTPPTQITTFYPHTRITSTLIASQNAEKLTIFHLGIKTELHLLPPSWHARVLGTKEVQNSVKAPMPCKILRNAVQEGDTVEAGQELVVIESMKMETVIRSPLRGTVRKLIHAVGDICNAGTVLVLFEEGEMGEGT